jgi:cytosine/uracil/thiamine/allantoin permease
VSSGFAVDAVRIALAILLNTTALVIWDIGTRSPVRLLADVRAGLRERRSIVRGVLRAIAGSLAMGAAVAVSAPAASRSGDLSVIECWALVMALAIEQLVGPVLRFRRR